MSSEQSFHFITGLKNSYLNKNDTMNISIRKIKNFENEVAYDQYDDPYYPITDEKFEEQAKHEIIAGGYFLPYDRERKYFSFYCQALKFSMVLPLTKKEYARFDHYSKKISEKAEHTLIVDYLNRLYYEFKNKNEFNDFEAYEATDNYTYCLTQCQREDFEFYQKNRFKIVALLASYQFELFNKNISSELTYDEVEKKYKMEYQNSEN